MKYVCSLRLRSFRSLCAAGNVENRLHDTLDLVFDRKFVPECSWKGASRLGITKKGMAAQTNILRLFKAVGSTEFNTCTDAELTRFFEKKLKHAKHRVNIQGYRQTSYLSRSSLPNSLV